MIGYSQQTVRRNRDADGRLIGVKLGRYCVANEIPVSDVMAYFDVTKQTVYNWFAGTHVASKRHTKLISEFLAHAR